MYQTLLAIELFDIALAVTLFVPTTFYIDLLQYNTHL